MKAWPGKMNMGVLVRPALVAVVTVGAGWWLFADTYARHVPASSNGRTIRFAHFGTYHDYELWRDVIAAFEREHAHLSVRQEYIVGLAGQYNTKMRQQILSHTLPDVALVQLGPFHELFPHFADLSELLHDWPESETSLPASLDPTGLSAFQAAGRQRGLPLCGGNLLIYGNATCFKRASRHRGVTIQRPADDWTIEDFRRTAKLLTCDFDGDGIIDQFGFWHPRWIYYLPFMWSFGAELTDETFTQWKLLGPEAEQAFAFYRDLLIGDRVCPRDDEVPQLFQDTGFLTGKVAMCVNGPWFQPFLAETKLADSYFVAPIPTGPAGRTTRVTWDGVVIAGDLPAARRDTAWHFITFLLSKPVQDRIARTGRALPARRESAAAFIAPPGDERRQRFVEALRYSRTQPLLPRFGEVDRVVNEHLRRFLDPNRCVAARTMLEELARDPVIISCFPGPRGD